MPVKAALDCGSQLEFFCATWVHVAGKKEHACCPSGSLRSQDQSRAGTIAPADQTCLLEVQMIHHCRKVKSHLLIRIGSGIARAAAMAPAVDYNRTIATADQHWDLITPVATMTKPAMQQDHRRARPVRGVPNLSAVMFDVTLIIYIRQGRGAFLFK